MQENINEPKLPALLSERLNLVQRLAAVDEEQRRVYLNYEAKRQVLINGINEMDLLIQQQEQGQQEPGHQEQEQQEPEQQVNINEEQDEVDIGLIDLNQIDLSQIDLSNIDFSNIDVVQIDASKINLGTMNPGKVFNLSPLDGIITDMPSSSNSILAEAMASADIPVTNKFSCVNPKVIEGHMEVINEVIVETTNGSEVAEAP